MKQFLFIFIFIISGFCFSQNAILARNYHKQGNFEKAALYYENLNKKYPLNTSYLFSLTECYQQLEKYDDAEKILSSALKKNESAQLRIEIGYNYSLKKNKKEAEKNYDIALDFINENSSYAYSIGGSFRKKSLLDYTVKAFKLGMKLNSELNFNYDLANIYGELGDIENMYDTYLNLIAYQESFMRNVQRNIGRFITDESSTENNQLLRKLLLKRVQSDPNIVWNKLLSWLFIQQKQYASAFVQEKAIYKRAEDPSLDRITELGIIALNEKDTITAQNIFEYLIETTKDSQLIIQSHLHIIKMNLENESTKKLKNIEEKFISLLDEYGYVSQTINLQIAYANFLAFHGEQSQKAQKLLKKTLNQRINRFDQANVKMALADILVYDEKFNQALIFYSQIQKTVKNNVIAQNARFKVAQTSFYKGDFDWAETQLKVLKSSTSQLIANDALQLKLLISDNSLEDSTQTALKIYAKADLLSYQNKNEKAIALLNEILLNHKGESIEDEALLKQAKLFEKKKEYEKAHFNYLKVIEFYNHGILADDAIFNLAELYNNHLNDPVKAKELYEKIIFNHSDSIFFIEARKNYRKLRGDAIN